jgi:hypothetical protein
MEDKIKDISTRAGGGPLYVVLHSTDRANADPSKTGIKTGGWYRHFKPSGWEYPSYACVDGIGKTFVIDTALLFAAVEYDPEIKPSPVKTQLTLEEMTWTMFGEDEVRKPVLSGNAGNDAFVS